MSNTTFSKLCRMNGIFPRPYPRQIIDVTQPAAPTTLKRQKARVMHLAHAGNECRERSDDRDKLGVDDRLSAVTFVKGMGTVEILASEYFRVLAEEAIAERRPKQESNAVSGNRGDRQECDDHADLELAGAGHNPNREQ